MFLCILVIISVIVYWFQCAPALLESIEKFHFLQLKQGWDIKSNTELHIWVLLAMQNTCKVQAQDPHKIYQSKEMKNPWRSSKVGVLGIPWAGYTGCPYFQQRNNLQNQNELLNPYPVFVKSLELCWKSDSLNCVSHDFENLLNM